VRKDDAGDVGIRQPGAHAQAERFELLRLVIGNELVGFDAHACKFLDFGYSLDQLRAGQSRFAGGGVAEIFETVGRIARQRPGARHDMNAPQRGLILSVGCRR